MKEEVLGNRWNAALMISTFACGQNRSCTITAAVFALNLPLPRCVSYPMRKERGYGAAVTRFRSVSRDGYNWRALSSDQKRA